MKTPYLFTFIALLICSSAWSQSLLPLDAEVVVNGKKLSLPWVGGLNNPQFSQVDINGDDRLDLFVFDKKGSIPLAFIHSGEVGETKFEHAPEFTKGMPVLRNWALLRDFNNDGVMDIFTSAVNELAHSFYLYRGEKVGGEITYQLLKFGKVGGPAMLDPIPTRLPGSSNYTNAYNLDEDIPVVDDLDGDGDLDILAFDVNGSAVTCYQNRQVEDNMTDTVDYIIHDICWGGFVEAGLNADITLAPNPNDCGENGGLHAGSTLLTIDLDGDGDKEIILGDLANEKLTMLTNGGTPQEAWMTGKDVDFPRYDKSVDIIIFVAAFHVDVNGDGKRDFLAAPNAPSFVEDINCSWYYENIGTDAIPDFDFRKENFLNDEMIDMGTGAQPTFVDVDADGLLDLVVGNQQRFVSVNEAPSTLHYYRNTGTATEPAFQLIDSDWLRLSQYSIDNNEFEFSPAFGDMDSDGDLDLILGSNSGKLYLLENDEGEGNALSYNVATMMRYMDIDVGSSAIPQIVDLNRDGLNDLVIGDRSGNIRYLQNQGTSTVAFFSSDIGAPPNTIRLGNVATASSFSASQGYSAPVFVDMNGKYELFTGSSDRGILRYNDIEDNLYGDFTLTAERLGDVFTGRRMRPALADINADGKLDFVISNHRGGLGLYSSDIVFDPNVSVNDIGKFNNDVKAYPNPVQSNELYVDFANALMNRVNWQLSDAQGKIIHSGNWINQRNVLNMSELANGVYFLKLADSSGSLVKRVVVAR